MLSRNEIGDQGAFELGRAIEARGAFPNLRLVSMGGNALSVCRRGLEPQASTPQTGLLSRLSLGQAAGEAALREVCEAAGVSVFGVGALRGAPLAERFKQASWLEAADPAAATRSTGRSSVSEQDFARGVRERAVARGDPFIASAPG
jgi:hypothetical protein